MGHRSLLTLPPCALAVLQGVSSLDQKGGFLFDGLEVLKVRPSRVVVVGDSAGGNLTLALLVALRDTGAALPAGGFLIGPGTDLAHTGDTVRKRADVDPMRGSSERTFAEPGFKADLSA
jgi:acetyl esterase/lipase